MRINHNSAAMNTYSRLSSAQGAQAKSLEKLSSGLRINRAGDDAAGLAISEKMRGQISGLNQASRNAQDGISLIQTAEGGLNETHSILQRMRELAVQSSNDTNTTDDRGAIQKEMNQLAEEVTRIADTTKFNNNSLMAKNDSFSGNFMIGANKDEILAVEIGAMDSETLKVGEESAVVKSSTADSLNSATISNADITNYNQSNNLSVSMKITTPGAAGNAAIAEVTIGKQTFSVTADAVGVDSAFTLDGSKFDAFNAGESVVINTTGAIMNDAAKFEIVGQKNEFVGLDISDSIKSQDAIVKIDDAIKTVSGERSKLGAVQNRLDHTINNLTTTSENISAAESRIRDVDMAKEMMEFTKNNILNQASTAMLAQANQMPQGVLQLLG